MDKEEKKIYNKEKILVRDDKKSYNFDKERYIGGYDRVFILKNNNNRVDLSEENNFSEVSTENMTDAQLGRAFINNQTSRKKDRVFVNKFVEMVA